MTKRLSCAKAVVWFAAVLLWNAPARGQSASAPGSFVEVDGAKLYYEECGSGPQSVVAVGASAGGLEAFTQLLRGLPDHVGTCMYARA